MGMLLLMISYRHSITIEQQIQDVDAPIYPFGGKCQVFLEVGCYHASVGKKSCHPKETEMNPTRFSKLFYVLSLFVLVACQAQATPLAPTDRHFEQA